MRVFALSFLFLLAFLSFFEMLLRYKNFYYAPWDFKGPFFIEEEDGYMTNPQYTRLTVNNFINAHPQWLKKEKETDIYRIALLGESTVFGLGEATDLKEGIIRRIREEFSDGKMSVLEPKIEIINLGFQSCGSDRTLITARELHKIKPDLVLIYSGHSELTSLANPKTNTMITGKYPILATLLRFRLLQIILYTMKDNYTGEDKQWVGQFKKTFSQEEKGLIFEEYRANLEKIVDESKKTGAKVILSTLGYNLRAIADLKLTESNYKRIDKNNGDLENIQRFCGMANYHYQKKNFLLTRFYLDKYNENNPAQGNASVFSNKIVAQTAIKKDVIYLDAEEIISQNSENGITGYDFFADHCHFNQEGSKFLQGIFVNSIFENDYQSFENFYSR